MRRQSMLLAASLAALIISIVAIAAPRRATVQGASATVRGQGKPTPTPAYNLTSTIYDFDTLGSPLQIQSDDLNVNLTGTGDSYGIYQTDSATNVFSQFTNSESTWNLAAGGSTSRSVNLTFSRLTGSGPTGGPNSLHANVISRCFDPTGATTNAVNWFAITTSDPNCSMRVNFTLSGTQYALVMSPTYSNTGRAIVSCTQVSGSSCFGWSILPNPTQSSTINPNPTVANLYSVNPRNLKETFVGTYTLLYRASVTYP